MDSAVTTGLSQLAATGVVGGFLVVVLAYLWWMIRRGDADRARFDARLEASFQSALSASKEHAASLSAVLKENNSAILQLSKAIESARDP